MYFIFIPLLRRGLISFNFFFLFKKGDFFHHYVYIIMYILLYELGIMYSIKTFIVLCWLYLVPMLVKVYFLYRFLPHAQAPHTTGWSWTARTRRSRCTRWAMDFYILILKDSLTTRICMKKLKATELLLEIRDDSLINMFWNY